jgi:CBS domain-containing protein
MTAAENAGLLFFTELVGLPVFDLKHRRIGRVRDAAVVPLIHPSRVDRILVGAGTSWLSVRYDQISQISLKGIHLSNEKLYPYHSDEYMLRIQRDLLDQQIIDVNGRKVVRVNDVTMEIMRNGVDSLNVLEVDVGVRSIFRRLTQGVVPAPIVRRLQRPIPPNSIRWEFCNIVEADPLRRLRLNISNEGLEKMHPADLADIVEELGNADREAIFEAIDTEVAAEALSEVDPKVRANILESLEPEVAAEIVEEMAPDEAAAVLSELETETTEDILEEMDVEPVSEVRELLEYEFRTAGGMMNTEAIQLPEDATQADAVAAVRARQEQLDTLHIVVLTNGGGRVTGTVPIARLLLSDHEAKLKDLADERLISVQADERDERAAELVDKYNLLALPVLDEDGTLAGIITADDVISFLRQR